MQQKKYLILAEGIDDDSFELLDNSTIDLIIQKCGPRLIFKNKYWPYKNMYSLSGAQGELNNATPSTSDDTDSVLTYASTQELQTLIPTESAETSFGVNSQSTAVVTSPSFDTNNFDISFCLPPKRIKTSSVFDDVSRIEFYSII